MNETDGNNRLKNAFDAFAQFRYGVATLLTADVNNPGTLACCLSEDSLK